MRPRLSTGSGSGSDLVPGVGPVRGADEHGQDLGSGQQGGCPLGHQLRVEVVGALLEHEVRADVGGGEHGHEDAEEAFSNVEIHPNLRCYR